MAGSEPVAVLLIEGNQGGVWAVPSLLAHHQNAVRLTCAADLRTGIQLLISTPPDVVLLVVNQIDAGLASIEEIRGHCGKCPIIVLGNIDDPAIAAQFEAHGAADYLAHSPSAGPTLLRAIRYAVTRITDLKHMEDALAAERNLLRAVIDSIPDHIYVKDIRHRFLLANIATQKFFSASDETLPGKTDGDFFPPDAASSFQWEEDQVLYSGQTCINREERIISADGKLRWNLTTKVPLRDKRGNIIGLVGINRDITERKRAVEQLERTNAMLERRERELLLAVADLKQSHETLQATQLQLLQVEKMESVGRLAAGIAHEVKNPLAIISAGIEFLNQAAIHTPETDPMKRALGSMGRAVKRADSVIRGLLDFSAPASLCAEACDLNSVIRQSLVLIDHELLRCNVSLTLEFADSLPQVCADANKLEQVFLNLFINAIQAMPQGGTLTLRTRADQFMALGHNVGDTRAERFRPGDFVVVAEVDDTGHGIPEEKLTKVFDPFFTTKPTGKGTGLGLTVARTIVELHGGLLHLCNRAEGGVRAALILKATGDLPNDDNQSSQDAGADCGRRAGLYVDDGHGAAADRVV